MSLRAFHLLFIGFSVVLSAYLGAWAASEYHAAHGTVYLLTAVGSVLAGGALAGYGAAFQRKTRAL